MCCLLPFLNLLRLPVPFYRMFQKIKAALFLEFLNVPSDYKKFGETHAKTVPDQVLSFENMQIKQGHIYLNLSGILIVWLVFTCIGLVCWLIFKRLGMKHRVWVHLNFFHFDLQFLYLRLFLVPIAFNIFVCLGTEKNKNGGDWIISILLLLVVVLYFPVLLWRARKVKAM